MLYEINTPHPSDLPLLLALGLNEFICESNVETCIGRVEEEGYTVEVFVICAPAQFWRFDILCKEDMRSTVLESGSGCFAQFWPTVEMIGQNLLSVTSCGEAAK